MGRRLEFRDDLQEAMGQNRKLYFQPPNGTKLTYPCAIYQLQNIDTKRADDSIYNKMTCYQVTVIDPDPDSELPDSLLNAFQYIKFDRFFTSDNLNHYVFTIYF